MWEWTPCSGGREKERSWTLWGLLPGRGKGLRLERAGAQVDHQPGRPRGETGVVAGVGASGCRSGRPSSPPQSRENQPGLQPQAPGPWGPQYSLELPRGFQKGQGPWCGPGTGIQGAGEALV